MIKFPGWRQQNNEGPPDLDEVMRDLSRKINAMFGKNGGNQSNSQPKRPSSGTLICQSYRLWGSFCLFGLVLDSILWTKVLLV